MDNERHALDEKVTAGEDSTGVPGYVWHSVKDKLPKRGTRVLTFSPCYEVGSEMRIRMMDGQFVKLCTDVTKWHLPIEPV